MGKGKTKESHFIPSPFPTVTQYERAFVRAWEKTNADAVAEVLRYVAHATALAIKQNGEEKSV